MHAEHGSRACTPLRPFWSALRAARIEQCHLVPDRLPPLPRIELEEALEALELPPADAPATRRTACEGKGEQGAGKKVTRNSDREGVRRAYIETRRPTVLHAAEKKSDTKQ